jgi:hypothetical protein
MTEEERRQMASRATSTLGRNLAVGGFGNPMQYTPPERRSPFTGTAEQFARMPEQAAAPSNLFGSMVAPRFPENYSQQLGRQQAMDLGSTPSMAPTTDAISSFGNPMGSQTIRISNQYGTGSTTLTPEQQTARYEERQRAEQMGTMPRTPEQQQALLAQARQTGSEMRERMRVQEAERQEGLRTGYYNFRQRQAETEAQKALSREGGRSPDTMRGAQALVRAEEMKQIQAGRRPMSREPINALAMQFQRGSMGQYSPIRNIGNQTLSPFSNMPSMGTSFSSPTGMGDIFSSFRAFDDEYQSPFYSFGSRI